MRSNGDDNTSDLRFGASWTSTAFGERLAASEASSELNDLPFLAFSPRLVPAFHSLLVELWLFHHYLLLNLIHLQSSDYTVYTLLTYSLLLTLLTVSPKMTWVLRDNIFLRASYGSYCTYKKQTH